MTGEAIRSNSSGASDLTSKYEIQHRKQTFGQHRLKNGGALDLRVI